MEKNKDREWDTPAPEEMEEPKRKRRKAPWIILIVILAAAAVFFGWPYISGRPQEMDLIGSPEVTTPQGSPYEDAGVVIRTYGQDESDRAYVRDEVDTERLGTYTYAYCVQGNWAVYEIRRTVTVVDGTPPEVTLLGDESLIVDDIEDFEDPGVSATDNCDGDLSAEVQTELTEVDDYTYTLTYSVSDAAGNESSATREVIVRDVTPPEITLVGKETFAVDRNGEFTDPGVTAIDDRDGDITDRVVVDGEVNTAKSGTYTLTYQVTDSFDNTAEVTREVIVKGDPSPTDHAIYLTFDDGPSSRVTEQILDILKENDIQATFFILNYSEDKLPLIQRMLDEGHTIGIHGYSHAYGEIYTSVDAFMENINLLANKLRADTGYDAFCLRFPGGSSNTVSRSYCEGVMTDLVQTVTAHGWMYFDWNVDSEDAEGNNVDVDRIIDSVESGLSPDRANVVLMHDANTKQTTADALQEIIDYGVDHGYDFYPITRETPEVHHEVNN